MKARRFFATILILLIAFAVCLPAISLDSAAISIPQQNGAIYLTVADSQTKQPIENVKFRLYYVASVRNAGNNAYFDYISPYNECNMPLGNLQDAYLPLHLAVFAMERNLAYTEESSDKNGHILFNNLELGVYLLVPDIDSEGGFRITPFLVCVPMYDTVEKEWEYSINATPKIEDSEETDETTYISVKKLWDTHSDHPDEITVSLLRDFVAIETVVLNDENNWTYRWNNLSKNYVWDIIETEVPDGYIVSYDTSSNTVIITNKDTTPTPPPPPTEPGDSPKPPDDELIDTGQLNWPVPILSAIGLLLFATGWAMLNLGKREEYSEEDED